MCRPFIFIVLQVLTLEFVTSYPYKDYIIAYIPVEELAYLSPQNIAPHYNTALFYDPWYYRSMMMKNFRTPFRQTTGPVTFGGQVKGKGSVKIIGNFGNQGSGTVTSYSAPLTPLTVTPQPALPTATSLPSITTLPEVSVPSTTITQTFEEPMPSTVSVPDTPMPFIVVTTTVPTDVGSNSNVASPVKFSGRVPASGRVRISAHFC